MRISMESAQKWTPPIPSVHSFKRVLQNAAPVPDAITATEPVGWTKYVLHLVDCMTFAYVTFPYNSLRRNKSSVGHPIRGVSVGLLEFYLLASMFGERT
ncbi:hypothetical protein AVEN_73900-1 [Araneus ventricosus]|uniref:Uncharacterized protein n=1 Tax=Araneus ventricosus TaxID=182803 RepID=A0A4Y2BNF0_ARAVE|nr:hypothetical protein AVEN_73900-1 [Araneus ventricosus]